MPPDETPDQTPDDRHVQRLAAAALVDLRQRLLRPNQPRERSIYDGDDEPTTIHLGVLAPDETRVLACGTFLRNDFRNEPAWRLRGMAVDPAVQRSGLGGRILREAERILPGEGHSLLLWCYARTVATGFYQRNGWHVVSDVLDFGDVGPHVEMTKRLA